MLLRSWAGGSPWGWGGGSSAPLLVTPAPSAPLPVGCAPATQTDPTQGAGTLLGESASSQDASLPPPVPSGGLGSTGAGRMRNRASLEWGEAPRSLAFRCPPTDLPPRAASTRLVLGRGKDTLAEAKAQASVVGEMFSSQRKLDLADKLFK